MTDIVIAVDVAVGDVMQEYPVIEQVIAFPLASVLLLYVLFVAPVIAEPFNFH